MSTNYNDNDINAHFGNPYPSQNANSEPNNKTKNIQNQVDEVVGIMQQNINKVMERQEHLESMDSRAEELNQNSMQFKRSANQVRKRMWYKDMKMKIIIGVVVAIIILTIILSVVYTKKESKGNSNTSPSDNANK